MSKAKKRTKTKSVKTNNPIQFGIEQEDAMAETICKKYLKVGVDKYSVGDAFIGAFNGLTYRMFNIFPKEIIFDLVSEIAEEFPEEVHVCKECQKQIDDQENTDLMVVANKDKLH